MKSLATLIVLIWLAIGAFAAYQRDYFSSGPRNCSHFSNTALTIVAGPLNYVGINPKVACKTPQPSK